MTPEQSQDIRHRIDMAVTANDFAGIDRELQNRVDRDAADVQGLVKHLEGRSGRLVFRAMFRAMHQGIATRLQQEIGQRSGSGYTFRFSHAMDVPEFAQIIAQIEQDDHIEAARVGGPIFENHKRLIGAAEDAAALETVWQGILDDMTLSHDERGRLAARFGDQQATLAAAQAHALEVEVGTEALTERAQEMGSVLAEDRNNRGVDDDGFDDDDDDLDEDLDLEDDLEDLDEPVVGHIAAAVPVRTPAQERISSVVNTVAAGFAAQRGVQHDTAVALTLKDRILGQVINAEALAEMEEEVPGIGAAFTQVAEQLATIEMAARRQGR